jgi:uroporphyrinogen decarboxylase
MNHRQRLIKCFSGNKIDRPPVALWRHFPVEDQDPFLLAKAIVNFQQTYDFDLVKITPASSFCLLDWGVRDEWRGNPEGTREIFDFPIKKPEDWLKLKPLQSKNNHLSAQLECIKQIQSLLPKTTPIIQTIFNPLSQAKNLVGKNNLPIHIRLYPDEVKYALQVITETTITFLKSLSTLDLDGVFYAVQHAQAGLLSKVEFCEFSRPYDLAILEYGKNYWLNMLHIHGENIYFKDVSDYPCQVFNWHDQQTFPSLEEAKSIIPGVVCGGLRQWETLVNGYPEMVFSESSSAIKSTKAERFILGTGCVLPITAPHTNIMSARESVMKVIG